MSEAILTIDSITVSYGKIVALRDVSLSVKRGQLYTVVGANGAGKSTLLKTISGLLRPRTGKIYLNGEIISGMEGHLITRRGVAHVPEGRQLFPNMTVLENIEMGALKMKKSEFAKELTMIFELFPILEEKKNAPAHTLSGGQQQMLAIARGIVSKPEVLLLDEPTLGLAPIIIQELAEIIKRLHQTGMTIILVEQNAHLALSIAERGGLLQNGQLVLEDDVEALRENEIVKQTYLGLN